MSPESQLAAFKHAVAGRYLIDAEEARGGMAVVFAAREVRLGRRVALKVLSPAVASLRTVTAFRRELSHTIRLEHPHILPLTDAGEAEGLPFYAMRYARGGSLRQRLARRGRLTLPETVEVTRQVAAALQFAHDRGILHCDVKPENILFEGEHAYLADFGISRAVRPDAFTTEAGTTREGGSGTASYVSPEQALGTEPLDGRADLYSLACVAYEMLLGRAPFAGENHRDVIARRFVTPVRARGFSRPVPSSVRAALERALSIEPAHRQVSVRAFAHAVDPTFARAVRAKARTLAGSARRALHAIAAAVSPGRA